MCMPLQGAFEIFYHHGQPVYSLYQSDDEIICVLNKLANGGTQKLPSFKCRLNPSTEGLFDIFKNEIDNLQKYGKKVDISKISIVFN